MPWYVDDGSDIDNEIRSDVPRERTVEPCRWMLPWWAIQNSARIRRQEFAEALHNTIAERLLGGYRRF